MNSNEHSDDARMNTEIRKRPRANSIDTCSSQNIMSKNDEMEQPPTHKTKSTTPTIKKLRLEAFFHAKFENENQNDQQIRKNMIRKVSTDEGYLEVTLKHSGSLLLWSGDQRFYSKNATNNVFTAVGEILLRQHFSRAWDSVEGVKYKECSDYVQQHRLTLSFELVSAVLGHHGDIPNRDFMILIAVADRNTGRFYSTSEIVAFAQQFRLPHNDSWIFHSAESAEKLFELYDSSRETGMASDVIDTLDQAADGGHVRSMYPHMVFQGEILEGIVIRYVSYEKKGSKEIILGQIDQLCHQSEEMLKLVPPSKIIPNDEHTNDLLRCSLRDLADNKDFDDKVQTLLNDSHGAQKRNVTSLNDLNNSNLFKDVDMKQLATDLLSSSDTDFETRRIAQLIQTLGGLKASVTYKVVQETVVDRDGKSGERHLCIIHVHHDASFQKYYNVTKTTGAMMLYRGFSIQLIPEDQAGRDNESDDKVVNKALELVRLKSNDSTGGEIEEKLMLKMKFLPYMVRTFICRNGLTTLTKSGVAAFEHYALNQLTKWDMSQTAMDKWMPFFKGWALYCQSPPSITSDGKPLCALTSASYLYHYDEFATLYSKGQFQSTHSDKPAFRGLVVLVGLNRESLFKISRVMLSELGCTKMANNVNDLSQDDMMSSIQRNGGGLVCASEITDGVKNVRALAKSFENAIYIVMVGCSEDDLDSSLVELKISNHGEARKTIGIAKSWRKCKCNLLVDLPRSALLVEDDDLSSVLRESSVLKQLKESSDSFQTDERPGMVVFFPVIPGSGKSALCSGITTEALGVGNSRKLLVREGDKVKGKFYAVVEKEVLDVPAAILIADKNVPPISWSSISNICTKSRSVAVAVFPTGMEDTVIGDQISSHIYPFSLHYLAVCMYRVLSRDRNTHNGKLDAATETACMIVIKFYCLYRNVTNAQLGQRISTLGKSANTKITVPFFKDGQLPALPVDLKQALLDAVNQQTHNDMKVGDSSEEAIAQMELTLRSCLRTHQSFLDNLGSPLDESIQSFQSQLTNAISCLGDKVAERSTDTSIVLDGEGDGAIGQMIKIVSLDVAKEDVHSALYDLAKESREVEEYFLGKEADKANDEDSKDVDRFISSTHCTFSHASEVSQGDMYSSFSHLLGAPAEIRATAFLFSDTIAAIEVEIPATAMNEPPSVIPRPHNNFAHITVWCAKETSAHLSNTLPDSVQSNNAKKMEFKKPVPLKGTFSFWYEPETTLNN